MAMKRFYLDENATTQIDPGVAAVMAELGEGILGNPSSLHGEGRRARGEIDAARDTVAAWLGAKPSEIIFTSGGTESCNLAILGLARAHRSRGRHLITAATEHHAVLHACQALEKREGFAVTYLPVDRDGLVDSADLDRAIRPETILVSIMSANNETGIRQPMCELGAICARHGVLFHSDAVQSAGKEALNPVRWNVAALSVAAHKFHGPLGAGVLYLKAGIPIMPLMEGGTHENERRPGTENTVVIAGLAKAVRRHGAIDPDECRRQARWIENLWSRLERLGEVRRNGHATERLANTLNVTFQGLHPEELLIALDLAGLAVSSGSACLVGSVQPSHVLAAMGLASNDGATVRFSIGRHMADEDLDEIAARIGRIVTHQRALRGTLAGVSV
jgi:cysteine desulfurase